ncbi:MAG: HEAT repeat domain-containing protein [Myxococcota bacterium]
MRWFATLVLSLALTGSALAAPSYFLPKSADGVESYVPVALDGMPATTLPGMADAALKRLASELPDTAAIAPTYAQNTVDLAIDASHANDAAVTDRALGAVYHTLKAIGFEDVRLGGKALSPESFTRSAWIQVAPLVAAVTGPRLTSGSVWVGGTPVPVSTFYKRLDTQDRDIQVAARALIEGGSPEVRLALVTALDALKLKEREAIELGRLDDGDARVRVAALAYLERGPSPAAVKALQALVEKDTDNVARARAVKILVAAGKKEYQRYLLLDTLQSADAAQVMSAAKSLVASKDKRFAPALAGLATHSSPDVRKVAVQGLAELGELGLVAQILQNDKVAQDTREVAALALTKSAVATDKALGITWLVQLGTPEDALAAATMARDEIVIGTVGGLAKALSRPEADVRKTSAQALGKLKDAAGLEALATALRAASDADEKQLYTDMATAIVTVQPVDQAIAIASSKDVTVRELAIRALAGFAKDRPNPKVLEVLKGALSEQTASIREAAAYALAHVPDESVAAELGKLADDGDPLIRAQVVFALAHSKQPNADAVIVKYLDDKEGVVKEAALAAVQFKKLATAVDKVRWLTSNRKVEVRREAMRALVLIAQPGDPQLFEVWSKAMLDEDEELRILAIKGLSAYPANDARVAQAIGTPLSDDKAPKNLKLEALKALAVVGGADAVEHAVRGLFDDDRDVRMTTLATLESLKSDKAKRPLQEFIMRETDKDVKARAEQVWGLL